VITNQGHTTVLTLGTRSRRRASQPKTDQAARSAVRAGSANPTAAQGCAVGRAPPSARSAGVFGGSGACFLWGTFLLHEQRKVPRRRAASGIKTVNNIAAGETFKP